MWAAVSTNAGILAKLWAAWTRARHADDLQDAARRRREHRDPVGQDDRLVDVVGDEEDGLRADLKLAGEPVADLLALHLVEGRERLVHQQHLRIVSDGAGDVHPLDHPARELARSLLLVAGQPEVTQQVGGCVPLAAGDPLGECHVVDGPLPGQHGRPLRDEPEQARLTGLGRRRLADPHLARRGHQQVGHDSKQRRLAAAGRPDERDELAGRDLEVDRVEREIARRSGARRLGSRSAQT